MHSRGTFDRIASYEHAIYRDVVAETTQEILASAETALREGVPQNRIVLDPGLGFAKTPEQSFAVLDGLPALASSGYPIMIGPSRKRFIEATVSHERTQRDDATAHVCVSAYMLGANLFRVHAVGLVKRALDVAAAIRSD
jgi:dihydropteroate synthase